MRGAARAGRNLSPAEWVGGFVDGLVTANDTDPGRVVYEAAPVPPDLRRRVRAVVDQVVRDVVAQFRRWGIPDVANRAELVVVTAFSLVHEVVISRPRAGTGALPPRR